MGGRVRKKDQGGGRERGRKRGRERETKRERETRRQKIEKERRNINGSSQEQALH